MAMRSNGAVAFKKLKSQFERNEKEFQNAFKYAMNESLRHGKTIVSKKLKGVFPAKVLKRRLLSRLVNTLGSIFVGLNPVDLAYLNPQKTQRGITANGIYYAGAFFKKNSPRKSVWMRKFQSRKDADPDEYVKLIKVVQELPVNEVEEVLENALDDMEAYFLKRYEHHLRRFDLIE